MRTPAYRIYPTSSGVSSFLVPKKTFVTDITDVTFFGKRTLEYGEAFNENTLHLLEHFAAHSNPDDPTEPNYDLITGNLLAKQRIGQIWYNKTVGRPFFWTGEAWVALGSPADVAGNMGHIMNGESLPRPISTMTGYEFEYAECSWNVSPIQLPQHTKSFVCETDEAGVVTCTATLNDDSVVEIPATYAILGIRTNYNINVDNNPVIQGDAPNRLWAAPYSYAYSVVYGTAPFTFTLASGSLPPGMSLSSEGLLTAPPLSDLDYSSYTFTIQVTDANSLTDQLTDTIQHVA